MSRNDTTVAAAAADTITIHVLFFASARENANGLSSLDVTLSTVAAGAFTNQLRTELAQRFPPLASLLQDDESITLAVNEEYVPAGQDWPLASGDTVALIPPISGG